MEPYQGKFKRNKAAWKFFQSQPPSYRKVANWWVISANFILFFVAVAAGVPIDTRDLKGSMFAASVIALLPAAAGYLLVRKAAWTIDKWRVRHGDDVYREKEYVDDGGFIHLNEVPACEQEQEVSVREIVSGLGQAAESDDLTKELK